MTVSPTEYPADFNVNSLWAFLNGKTWEDVRDSGKIDPATPVDSTPFYVNGALKTCRRAFIKTRDGVIHVAVETPGRVRKSGTVPMPEGWDLRTWDRADRVGDLQVSYRADGSGYWKETRATLGSGTTEPERERMERDAWRAAAYGLPAVA